MSTTNEDEPGRSSSGKSIWQNDRVRRLILYAALLLVVFLAGLVSIWLKSRTYARERDAAQASLKVSNLRNSLANAAIDARRAGYEPTRQAASDFVTNLGARVATQLPSTGWSISIRNIVRRSQARRHVDPRR